MLRLRRKLQARVPNKLAAICAVVLLVTSLGGMDESIVPFTQASGTDPSTGNLPRVELAEYALPNLHTSTGRDDKISLMIFRLN